MSDRKLPDDVARCDGRITTNPSGFGTISVGQAECLRCLRRTAAQRELAELREKYLALGVRVKRAEQDSKRIDWLADKNNAIGNVQLPTECVERNLYSLRAAIDDAMEGNHG